MSNDSFSNRLPLDETKREDLLDRLDQTSSSGASFVPKRASRANRRHDRRFTYRQPNIAIALEHPGGSVSRLLVCTRNISAGGLSFLHGGYLHNGSKCRVALRQPDGRSCPIDGKVVSCRHVESTLHEIGVRFNARIDPTIFAHGDAANENEDGTMAIESLTGTFLYVDASVPDQNLMRFFLESSGAQVKTASDGVEALTLVEHSTFPAIITEIDLPGVSGLDMVRMLRENGCRGRILAVTPDERAETHAAATQAGCDAVLVKPLDLVRLAKALRNACGNGEPLVSTRWTDPRMRPLILEFLARLEQDVEQLQTYVQQNDRETVRRMCMTLKGAAGGYGYPQISHAAQELWQCAGDPAAIQQLGTKARSLLEMCTAACRARTA